MNDTISRQAAINEFKPYAEYESNRTNKEWVKRIETVLNNLPSAQPKSEERTAESAQNVPNDELISKKAAMEAHCELCEDKGFCGDICPDVEVFRLIPSAQPTLYGYSIESLAFIAALLAKENLPPERVSDVLHDISQVVAIVVKEFEEMLRKAVTNNESKR